MILPKNSRRRLIFMMRLRLLVSMVLLLGSQVVMAQPNAAPAESSITITGRVQSEGKALEGALVTLWDQSYGVDPIEQ
jgi:hypothetical protein